MRAVAKITLTAALLGAVWFALGHLGHDASVPASRADILDLTGTVEPERAFRQALEEMGHEKAREYVLNGNQIRVSTAELDLSPRRAMEQYQKAFVRRGLNDETYTSLSPTRAIGRTTTGLTGGVVPAIISRNKVVMRGVSTRGGASDWKGLLQKPLAGGAPASMSEMFEGFRWVELHRAPRGGPTRAVAIWNGPNFDYDRMFPGALEKRAARADLDLPHCPNCTLVNQFSDPDRAGRSQAYLYFSDDDPERLADYYADTCGPSGDREARRWLDRLRRRFEFPGRQMRRIDCRTDTASVEIKIYPSERGRTAVRMEAVPREQAFDDQTDDTTEDDG